MCDSHEVSTTSPSTMLTVLEDPVIDLQSHSDSRTYVQTSVTLENAGQNSQVLNQGTYLCAEYRQHSPLAVNQK